MAGLVVGLGRDFHALVLLRQLLVERRALLVRPLRWRVAAVFVLSLRARKRFQRDGLALLLEPPSVALGGLLRTGQPILVAHGEGAIGHWVRTSRWGGGVGWPRT